MTLPEKKSVDLADLKVAIVYDRVNTPYGGAENVLLALHEIFPRAPLYTSVYDPSTARWAKVFHVRTTFLQRLPLARKMHRFLVALMPLAFESLDFSEFDIIISVTSAEAKGVLTKPHQLHLCYLLTPTRYLWSHAEEYQQHWLTGPLRKLIFDYLRWWDQIAALRPDVLIPISKLVASRSREYYAREPADVIYPTVVQVKNRHPEQLQTNVLLPQIQGYSSQYYLIVSRLVPYKRIDLAIQACQRIDRPLVIIGDGPDLGRLRSMAEKRNASAKIFFLQAVHPAQLPAYYAHCRAYLAPAEEDFGITVVEAQQYGKPVITYAKSGGAEVVEEGKTGIHFLAQAVEDLSEAMHIVESHSWEESVISREAAPLSQENFRQQFKKSVEYHWKRVVG
jgi:glycosyltransferase involved in cell wall biosynthesis